MSVEKISDTSTFPLVVAGCMPTEVLSQICDGSGGAPRGTKRPGRLHILGICISYSQYMLQILKFK